MGDLAITTRPFLFPMPLKAPGAAPTTAGAMHASMPPPGGPEAGMHLLPDSQSPPLTSPEALLLVASVKSCREKVLQDLSSLSTDPAARDASLQAYLAVMLPLVPGALPSADKAAAPLAADARGLGAFGWPSVLSAPGSYGYQVGDALFDCSCMVLSSALWGMAKAAAMVKESKGVLTTDAATQASKLLHGSASELALLRDRLLPLKLPTAGPVAVPDHVAAGGPCTGPSSSGPHAFDLEPELLTCLEQLALAQAQSLALLRAIAKGHLPGTVCAVAVGTADLYGLAFVHLTNHIAGRASGAAGGLGVLAPHNDPSKLLAPDLLQQLGRYMRYMCATCYAYAYAFSAMDRLKALKGGQAVRIAAEAMKLLEQSEELGDEYDRALASKGAQAQPAGPNAKKEKSNAAVKGRAMPAGRILERGAFQEDVEKEVTKLRDKVDKDNREVFYERAPEQLPEDALPAGKRLVDEREMGLPAPAPEASRLAVSDLAAYVVSASAAQAQAAAHAAKAAEDAAAAASVVPAAATAATPVGGAEAAPGGGEHAGGAGPEAAAANGAHGTSPAGHTAGVAEKPADGGGGGKEEDKKEKDKKEKDKKTETGCCAIC